jgi:hypothetical protein
LNLRDQLHEGFLNLLSSAITQLGYDIEKFVPSFMSILLALCKYSQIAHVVDVSDGDDMDGTEVENEDKPCEQMSRKGVVRTLCFRRLVDLYEKYANLTNFLPYAKSMWEPLAISVHKLPVTVAYADKAPALLCLLQTLSSHPLLIPILAEHKEAVPSVMKCIADTSRPSVANTSLDFVDNLLTNGGKETGEDFAADSIGVNLIQRNLSLLLHQFAIRIGSTNLQSERSSSTLANSEKAKEFIRITQRGVSYRFFVVSVSLSDLIAMFKIVMTAWLDKSCCKCCVTCFYRSFPLIGEQAKWIS